MKPPSLLWHNSSVADAEQVCTFMEAFYHEDASPYEMSRTQFARTFREFHDRSSRGRILLLSDVRQTSAHFGYALLASFWSNELGGELCVVDELYVSPAHRRQGWAKNLIQRLVKNDQDLWPSHAKFLELEVSPHNDHARTLYESMGFSTIRNSVMRIKI